MPSPLRLRAHARTPLPVDIDPSDALAVLDARWRRLWAVLREERDHALMLVLEFEERLCRLERLQGLQSPRVGGLDVLVERRLQEALRPRI